jgi:ABC-type sulfate transport system permease subunit
MKNNIILTLFVLFSIASAYALGIGVWVAFTFLLSLLGVEVTISPWVGGAVTWIVFGTIRFIYQRITK